MLKTEDGCSEQVYPCHHYFMDNFFPVDTSLQFSLGSESLSMYVQNLNIKM